MWFDCIKFGPLRPSGTSPKWDIIITYENCMLFVVPFGGGAPLGGAEGAEFDTMKP
jgi:hypothetical protein